MARRTTVKLYESQEETVDDVVANHDNIESAAAAVRHCIDGYADDDGGDVAELEAELADAQEQIERLQERREELIRADERVNYMEDELERVREERDGAQARLNEANGKLKLHNSETESPGRFSRIRSAIPI